MSEIGSRGTLPRLLTEGLTIIAGVLIALAADRAMTRVDEHSLEREYLTGLVADLRSLADAARQAASEAEQREGATRVVLTAARGRVPAGSSGVDLARALALAGFVTKQPFVRETWDDIVGTGRLYVLRDEDLRRRISSFYRHVDQVQIFNDDWVRQASDYGKAVRRILDPEVGEAVVLELIYGQAAPPSITPTLSQVLGRLRLESDLLPTLSAVLLIDRVAGQLYESLAARAESLANEIGTRLQAS